MAPLDPLIPTHGSIFMRDDRSILDKLKELCFGMNKDVRGLGETEAQHSGRVNIQNLTTLRVSIHCWTSKFHRYTTPLTGRTLESHRHSQNQAHWLDEYRQKGNPVCLEPLTATSIDVDLDSNGVDGRLDVYVHLEDGSATGWECILVIPTSYCSTQVQSSAKVESTVAALLAIYEPRSTNITLLDKPPSEHWLRGHRDDRSLAALSIPGTHNTPTYHHALPSVRCQAVSPSEQLMHGVRFFDVRLQLHRPDDIDCETLYLVHGAFPISFTGPKRFRDFLNTVEAFLESHPGETLIMSLKREGTGTGTDGQLADCLARHYITEKSSRWFTEARIPTLGEVRGKVVLMRRFTLSKELQARHPAGWGLDAESWPDNAGSAVHGNVNVQDFYDVKTPSQIPQKFGFVTAQIDRASDVSHASLQPQEQRLFLNFLTASNFWHVGCWPRQISSKLNPGVKKYLCGQHAERLCKSSTVGDGVLGVVVCDWVGRRHDWDLVDCIIGMNSVHLVKAQKALAAAASS